MNITKYIKFILKVGLTYSDYCTIIFKANNREYILFEIDNIVVTVIANSDNTFDVEILANRYDASKSLILTRILIIFNGKLIYNVIHNV